MSTTFNPDTLISRLQERRETSTADEYCLNCSAQITEADIEAGECTQCGSSLESDDEDLREERHES